MTISPFKLQIKIGGEIRWADADRVFAHLMERYTKKQYKLQDNLEKRLEKFSKSLDDYIDNYEVEVLEDFMEYWTEPNKSGTKMRFELEKTWSLSRRLKTWNRNGFGKKKILASSYKFDSTGNFYTAYCEKCMSSESYKKPQYEESRCCNATLLDKRRK
tara:strand:+ start:73 stop:549 length:477 start_codon:yes stop_codon:yes gene_type:complete